MSDDNAQRDRAIPRGRLSRLGQFGRLAAGLAGGVAAEGTRRLAAGERPRLSNLVMTPANVRRVTDRLSHLRGAAMKLGQMISLNAGDLLPDELASILATLRNQAYRMPPQQLDAVLKREWGADWRQRFRRFDASPLLAAGCEDRGVACVQFVDRAANRQKGLVYRLADEAAAVIVEDQPTFVARWQAQRVAARAAVPVYAVNAACLVPPAMIGSEVRGRTAFLRQHEPARAQWSEWEDGIADVTLYEGPLQFAPDRLDNLDLDAFVAGLDIDHSLPVGASHPPGRDAALARLDRLITTVLPTYAAVRNDATRSEGASGLSPYLHFGVLGPREVVARVIQANVGRSTAASFSTSCSAGANGFISKRVIFPILNDMTGSRDGYGRRWMTTPPIQGRRWRRLMRCCVERPATKRGTPVSVSSLPMA